MPAHCAKRPLMSTRRRCLTACTIAQPILNCYVKQPVAYNGKEILQTEEYNSASQELYTRRDVQACYSLCKWYDLLPTVRTHCSV